MHAGNRRGDVGHEPAAGVQGRRLRAPGGEQSGRVHNGPAGLALVAVLHRHRQGHRRADLPRQRRRRGGRRSRVRARGGVAADVGQRRGGRPRVLPQARPQRDRRADVHAAPHVPGAPPALHA